MLEVRICRRSVLTLTTQPPSTPTDAPPDGLSPRLRISFFYGAFFAMSGIHLPFWPIWLSAQGIGAGELGLLLGVAAWARVLASPLVGNLADLSGERRRPAIWCAWASLLVAAQFLWAESFWPFLLLSILFGLVWSPILPFGESLALAGARLGQFDYGRVRVWGSVSFMLVNLAAGLALTGRPPELILPLVLAGIAACLLACHLLPGQRLPPARRERGQPVGRLLAEPRFVLFILAVGLAGASHAGYYAFSAIEWRRIGLESWLIGLLWAEGVLAEIAVFVLAPQLLRRFAPLTLLLVGALAGLVRWPLMALCETLLTLFLLQGLHALTFAASHLGAMQFLARAVPPALSASAQSLYSSVVAGILMGLALLLAGHLYGFLGAGAYHVMGLLSGLGAIGILWLRRHWTGTAIIPD